MQIKQLTLVDFRNYENAQFEIPDGLTVVHGPVGTGKTNLLDGLHFACTGRSCRTSNERELIRFGQKMARAGVVASQNGGERRFDIALEITPKRQKTVRADGEKVASLVQIADRPLVCVFLPDKLELVKGPAGGRRAHLDEFVAALWPARGENRRSYARALAQRNMLLGRVRAGRADRASLGSWNQALARAGLALIADRREAVGALSGSFGERARQLGLDGPAELRYRPRSTAATVEDLEGELEAATANDLDRGFTTHGPHRDDVQLVAFDKDTRRYGSQGQQRLALLSLLLAERDVLSVSRSVAPLLLLDDVLSELDWDKRQSLSDAVAGPGQTLISTADPRAADALGANVTQMAIENGVLVG